MKNNNGIWAFSVPLYSPGHRKPLLPSGIQEAKLVDLLCESEHFHNLIYRDIYVKSFVAVN